MKQYGFFDNPNLEYVITDPKTPAKWINYIGGIDFGGFVDQTGGVLLCKEDPALNRITKYIPQMPDSDFKGSTLYVRVKNGNSYQLLSPFYTPCLTPYDAYECHVGNGYTRILSIMNGIKTEVLIFVPVDSKREIRQITLTNLTDKPKEIDVIPLVEYSHFEAIKQFNNADWVPQTMQSEVFDEGDGFKIIKQYAFMKKYTSVNYFTANIPIDSFETDRKIFLGHNGYGTFASPESLFQESLSNYCALRGDNIAALMLKLGTLQPNESKVVITQLGQYSNFETEYEEIKKYRELKNVETAVQELAAKWNSYFGKLVVKTPDEDMNTMVNIHNVKQCMMTKNWSRFLSLYQLGLGSRGIGFRDTSQDLLSVMGIVPEETVDMMNKLLSTQMSDGSAMHQFYPLTMEATCGDAEEMSDRYHYYGDDHLWIVQTVAEYIKATGDWEYLNSTVPYYEKNPDTKKPLYQGTVLDHLLRSVQFTKNNVGQHGLPLLGFADWNDTVNLPKGAESIFNANLYGKALIELIELLTVLGQTDKANQLKQDYAWMSEKVNEACWDGEWFLRYFDHEGQPLGSHVNSEGKIYVNAQSWTILSGFADANKGQMALESVYKHLNTKNGIKLSGPGYNGYDPIKGGVSTYPPGAKENGGIFLHSNPWVMIAETILGNGNRGMAYYKQINPIGKNDKIDEFEVEPYVYPQNILGDEHPQFGLGRNSWLSGTASWAYQAATKYILGIRPTYKGLLIEPCIPNEWQGFTAQKVYRGKTINITIQNPNSISKGITKVLLNGQLYESNELLFDDLKNENEVIIVM